MCVLDVDAGHGDVGRDDFVKQLRALIHSRHVMVWCGHVPDFVGEEFGCGFAKRGTIVDSSYDEPLAQRVSTVLTQEADGLR